MFSHTAVTSPLFELVKVVELDIRLGNDSWTVRIELLRDTGRQDHFRCRVWESELYRLVPSFPQNELGEPVEATDEVIQVERPFPHGPLEAKSFRADSVDAAIDRVLDNLRSFLEYVTGEPAT